VINRWIRNLTIPLQGPDEVHIQQIGRRELKRAKRLRELSAELAKKEAALFKAQGIVAKL
jgi:acyl-CoA dehydrogenase